MIYLNVQQGCIPGHKQFSVTVDETTVNFGNIPAEVLIEILKDLQAETAETLKNLYS